MMSTGVIASSMTTKYRAHKKKLKDDKEKEDEEETD